MECDQGYCIEKATRLLYSFDVIMRALKRPDDEFTETKEIIQSAVHNALINQTKVLSHIAQVNWDPKDADTLIEKGHDGLEELLVKYGWLAAENTRIARERKIVTETSAELLALSRSNRAPARTLMYDALRKVPNEIKLFEPLREILEEVTQGRLQWNAVHSWCESHLVPA